MSDIGRLRSLLFELSRTPGLSGNEQPVVRALRGLLVPYADDVTVDPHGNIIAVRKGNPNGPKIMISAHSDEVGAVVTAIQCNGRLSFHTVGVVNPIILPSTRVRVANRFIGTVTSVPGHLANGDYDQSLASLYIDVGARNETQIRTWGIREGSPVVFESPLVALENTDLVMGKAIDNRIGCAILVHLFEELAGVKLPLTFVGVVNVMEEIGMRGARMTTDRVRPDFAIALDTVPADDSPESKVNDTGFKIGCGPVIQLWEGKADQFIGTVAHPRVRDLILDTATEERIEVQLSAAYGRWTTDAAAIHVTGSGVPTGFVSIPRRYAHTPNEILDLNDAAGAADIISAIICRTGASFNPDFLLRDD